MAKKQLSLDTELGREEVFMEIISNLLRYNDAERKHIAEEAEVHWTTLYNWTHGATINPHISTLARVARVLGYNIVLKRAARIPKLRRVK